MTKKYIPANQPKKGSIISVEPIRKEKDIKALSSFLSNHPRNHLLFIMGINNGLRISDLLSLKVSDVRSLRVGGALTIREVKTGRKNILMMNKLVHGALKKYLQVMQPENIEYLFKSQKGTNCPLSVPAVNLMMKKWTGTINLKGNYGTHTLRKTWGYQSRIKYGVSWEVISKRFGHSHPAITRRYLGIEEKEVIDALMNEIG